MVGHNACQGCWWCSGDYDVVVGGGGGEDVVSDLILEVAEQIDGAVIALYNI